MLIYGVCVGNEGGNRRTIDIFLDGKPIENVHHVAVCDLCLAGIHGKDGAEAARFTMTTVRTIEGDQNQHILMEINSSHYLKLYM